MSIFFVKKIKGGFDMFPYQYGQTSQNQLAYEQSLKNIINQANGQLQQLQNQPQMPMQQPQIHQNFQLAPNLNTSELESKYANLKLIIIYILYIM